MTGNNFTDAGLAEQEVELLAMVFRRLTCEEWRKRGLVEGENVAVQAELEQAQREEARAMVPPDQAPELADHRLEAPEDAQGLRS